MCLLYIYVHRHNSMHGHLTRTFPDTGESTHMVAYYLMSMPLNGYASVQDAPEEQVKVYKNFMVNVLTAKFHVLKKE